MRLFLRVLFRQRSGPRVSTNQNRPKAATIMAATGTITAAIYTATFSIPTDADTAPEDAKTRPHHVKHGKGFVNPWDSWRNVGGREIMMAMLM